jgi:hypothetical protein
MLPQPELQHLTALARGGPDFDLPLTGTRRLTFRHAARPMQHPALYYSCLRRQHTHSHNARHITPTASPDNRSVALRGVTLMSDGSSLFVRSFKGGGMVGTRLIFSLETEALPDKYHFPPTPLPGAPSPGVVTRQPAAPWVAAVAAVGGVTGAAVGVTLLALAVRRRRRRAAGRLQSKSASSVGGDLIGGDGWVEGGGDVLGSEEGGDDTLSVRDSGGRAGAGAGGEGAGDMETGQLFAAGGGRRDDKSARGGRAGAAAAAAAAAPPRQLAAVGGGSAGAAVAEGSGEGGSGRDGEEGEGGERRSSSEDMEGRWYLLSKKIGKRIGRIKTATMSTVGAAIGVGAAGDGSSEDATVVASAVAPASGGGRASGDRSAGQRSRGGSADRGGMDGSASSIALQLIAPIGQVGFRDWFGYVEFGRRTEPNPLHSHTPHN